MKKGYDILRIGGINVSSSRFIDVLEADEVNSLTIIDFESHSKYMKDLEKTINFFECQYLLKKLNIHWIKSGFLQKVFRYLSLKSGYSVPYRLLLKTFSPEILNTFNLGNYDLIWIGDNDFDESNLLFYLFHKATNKKVAFIRSYKETRFKRKWIEKYMLKNSDVLIFPHAGYLDFFHRLYSFHLKDVYTADIDWRYSKLIDFVKKMNFRKLSSMDGKPHVCLLTGRALSDPSERRSGFRYYFVPIVKELVRRGIYVHMHALKIVPSRKYGNVYEELARKTELFKIEKPLDLTVYSDGYQILKQYDAGILHSSVPSSMIDLYEFQKINIPNRLYEYQIADVVPITPKQALPAVEKIIEQTDFGIIYNDYDDLVDKLRELVSGNLKNTIEREKIKDFGDFSHTFLEIIRKW